MAGSATIAEHVCPRCGGITTPRGRRTPRFCARCGYKLGLMPSRGVVQQYARPQPQPTFPEAILAVFAGLLSILPMCGAVFSIVAIAAGVSMLNRSGTAPQEAFWRRVATIAIVLGVLGGILNLITIGLM